jgi:two-component system, cell cycle response regulator CpdR
MMARILIAEDDDTIRGLVVRALQQDGHRTVAAADGAEALGNLACNGGFDLLLTDISMPAMDGIDLALAAAREQPEITILLMTGYAEQHKRAHDLDALVHDVIAKPFSVEQIRGAVSEALMPGRR